MKYNNAINFLSSFPVSSYHHVITSSMPFQTFIFFIIITIIAGLILILILKSNPNMGIRPVVITSATDGKGGYVFTPFCLSICLCTGYLKKLWTQMQFCGQVQCATRVNGCHRERVWRAKQDARQYQKHENYPER